MEEHHLPYTLEKRSHPSEEKIHPMLLSLACHALVSHPACKSNLASLCRDEASSAPQQQSSCRSLRPMSSGRKSTSPLRRIAGHADEVKHERETTKQAEPPALSKAGTRSFYAWSKSGSRRFAPIQQQKSRDERPIVMHHVAAKVLRLGESIFYSCPRRTMAAQAQPALRFGAARSKAMMGMMQMAIRSTVVVASGHDAEKLQRCLYASRGI